MKTSKIFLSLIVSLALSLFVGVAVAQAVPMANPLKVAAVFFAVKAIYFYVIPVNGQIKNLLLAGVNKEIWLEAIKENFYSPYPWLDKVQDWSEWVEYNTINFASVGADPVILKNNASWPIVAAGRTDNALTIALATYDSTTTRVRNVEEIEAAPKKLESVIKQHKQSLLQAIVTETLFNYAPATAAAGAVACTGANRAVVIGAQSTVASTMTLSDIAGLQERWDALDFQKEGRTLVLSPYHRRDLMAQDSTLFKSFTDLKAGEALPLFGFDVYTAANVPLYTKTTLAIKAFGAGADNTNDCVASVAFSTEETIKCMGDLTMFWRQMETNPEQRADEVGFQMRFIGKPQRTTNFYQQALVSNRA